MLGKLISKAFLATLMIGLGIAVLPNLTKAQSGGAGRALLYNAGSAAGSQFDKGTVSWSQVDVQGTPAAEATVSFDELGWQSVITFFRITNSEGLAEYVVEVRSVPPDVDVSMRELRSFVSRSRLEERARPLIGTIVPKPDGSFWVVSPDTRAEVVYNMSVLLGGVWFEVALSNNRGAKGTILFEKGQEGEKIIRDVFDAWMVTPAVSPATDVPASQGAMLGCFRDPNNPFDLDGYLERSAQNTPQSCVQICRDRGFAFAGVQYGESCLCGSRYGQFGAADNCNMACTGDTSQICGGVNANSVYSTGL
ncbi:MAG: WSC domain-containing protein [Rhizobiales bacterium]|nr:WSC domain-containing protein [Hyphomicrobiales bacterium]